MSESAAKTRDQRVKPRFNIQVHARIKAQLIGSSSKYPFITENMSESGLLVQHESVPRPSFNTHSILEVWLSTDTGEEIYFFAKYVRKASDTSFAIRIIDIDDPNSTKYQDFIDAHREKIIADASPDDETS